MLVWLAWLLTLPPRPSAWLVVAVRTAAARARLVARASPGDRRGERGFATRSTVHALALVLLFALGVQFEDAHGVTTDGVIYFSQLRSVIFDRDLDVAAEFAFLGQPPRPYHVVPDWTDVRLAAALSRRSRPSTAVGRSAGRLAAPADPSGSA